MTHSLPRLLLLPLISLCLVAACSGGPKLPAEAEVSAAMQIAVEQAAGYRAPLKDALKTFYASAENRPAWLARGRVSRAADKLVEALLQAQAHGLAPARYETGTLVQRLSSLRQADSVSAEQLASLDVALSGAFLRYASDLNAGVIAPGSTTRRWPTSQDDTDYPALLRAAVNGDPAAQLQTLTPSQPAYARLQQARSRYAAIVDEGGWQTVAEGEVLEQDDHSPRIRALRARLAASGDIGKSASKPDQDDRFDAPLVAALRAFQDRHGLEEDAVLGPQTVQALNVSAQRRLQQIDANLERWRWLPNDLGERHVIVNIPEYRLQAFQDGEQALSMKVIVGKTYNDRETPIFTDEMQSLVFRPQWGIPHSIASEEILPKARADASYLQSKNYQLVADYSVNAEVFPPTPDNLDRVAAEQLRIRQTGGAHNSLGLVKFLFPNQFAVYLHDTPADNLFDKRERSFSHGCIRVEKPVALASYVLSRQGNWSRARIEAAMNSGERQQVELEDSIPVYILYWTSFVHEDGRLQFRQDIYGHDEQIIQALARG